MKRPQKIGSDCQTLPFRLRIFGKREVGVAHDSRFAMKNTGERIMTHDNILEAPRHQIFLKSTVTIYEKHKE